MKKRRRKEENKYVDKGVQRVLYSEINIQNSIDFYRGLKIPFSITISNFTVQIDSELEHLAYVKFPRSNKFFAAFKKLVKSINGMPVYTNDKYVKYHNTGFIYDQFYADKIYQIDIKSCYASILHNHKLISTDVYKYLGSLPKAERLSSIGAMASRKSRFVFDNKGEIEKYVRLSSNMSDFFYYCVQETYKIMTEAARILGNNFLFTWVDAIYFTDETRKNELLEYFRTEHKLDCSFSILTEFEVELQLGDDCYKLSYRKDGVPTYMYIPTPQSAARIALENHLYTFKKQTNGTNKKNNYSREKE